MINPVDRLPVVLKDLKDTFTRFLLTKFIWILIPFVIFAVLLLRLADSRDLVIFTH